MNDEVLELLKKVSNSVPDSATLPPACYTDPAVLARENDTLLSHAWIGIGRSDRWAKPGDYAAIMVAGAPVIAVRDESGSLRAYANTCRHRGTQLLQGEGSVPRIVCPFHGWTYALDGSLRGAMRMRHGKRFCLEDFPLIEYRAAEHQGFAFVSLDPAIEPLHEWLGNFDEHHSPWPLSSLVTTRRRELEVGCNWKLFLEVFNESYHLDYVHDATFGGIYLEPDPPDKSAASVYTQFSPTQGTGGLKKDEQNLALAMMPGLTSRNRSGTRYTWIFPCMTFAAGTEALWAYNAQPLGADRCHVTMWVCFPPQTIASAGFDEKAERYYARMDEALDEDIAVLESQQRGMSSPHATQGRWSELEFGAATFAGWYAGKLLTSAA